MSLLPPPPAAYAETAGRSIDAGMGVATTECVSRVDGYNKGDNAAANVFNAKIPHPVGFEDEELL